MIYLWVKPLRPGYPAFIYCYQHLFPAIRGGKPFAQLAQEAVP